MTEPHVETTSPLASDEARLVEQFLYRDNIASVESTTTTTCGDKEVRTEIRITFFQASYS